MPAYRMISADSHMIEPPNLWIERLDKKYRDSAPHVEESAKGSYFVAPGIQPSRVALGFAAGRSGKELEDYFKKGSYAVARPSGWDPVDRVSRSQDAVKVGCLLPAPPTKGERFPRLTLVSSENDSGWFPHYLYRLDHADDKFNAMSDEPLPMKPSVYVRRQVMVTFQDDPIGPMTSKIFGEDNYMWASDFPHSDSTWPNSRKVIDTEFVGLSEEVRNKIVCGNAAKVYGIKFDA